jgi:hypothetical protein
MMTLALTVAGCDRIDCCAPHKPCGEHYDTRLCSHESCPLPPGPPVYTPDAGVPGPTGPTGPVGDGGLPGDGSFPFDGAPDASETDGSTTGSSDSGVPECGSNKYLVCHNGHTICIDGHAVDKHLENHGDYLGECD